MIFRFVVEVNTVIITRFKILSLDGPNLSCRPCVVVEKISQKLQIFVHSSFRISPRIFHFKRVLGCTINIVWKAHGCARGFNRQGRPVILQLLVWSQTRLLYPDNLREYHHLVQVVSSSLESSSICNK